MSDFSLQKIGSYKKTVSAKAGTPMIQIILDPVQVAKIKEWDLGKVYIYSPKESGDILGLVKKE